MKHDACGLTGNSAIFSRLLSLPHSASFFYVGISYAGRETITQEQTSLRQALEQGAIRTYALTGHYPQSLDELLQDYNISFDADKFVVEYVPNGSNLLPSVSVLVLSSGKGGLS